MERPMPDGELSQMLRDYVQVAERLQQTHRTLEEEVQRLRRELKHKDRELERRRRLASMGEVAAGVAHEVRNPLGAIQLYSGLLKKQCGDLKPALRLIEKIEAGIQSIESVVRSTLALAPGRTGKFRVRRVGEIIDEAVNLSAEVFRRRNVKLERRTRADDARINCDADALQRVLVNLLINAAEASAASPDRAGHVSILTRVTARGKAVIRVRDDGPGLPPDAADKVFDPFFTTKEGGTGLGLAIAHRLVEAHGGRLSARNHRGGGAEFSAVFPLEDLDAKDDSGASAKSERTSAA